MLTRVFTVPTASSVRRSSPPSMCKGSLCSIQSFPQSEPRIEQCLGLHPHRCYLQVSRVRRHAYHPGAHQPAKSLPLLLRSGCALGPLCVRQRSRHDRPLGHSSRMWPPSILRVQAYQQLGRLGPSLCVSPLIRSTFVIVGFTCQCLLPRQSRSAIPLMAYHSC